MTALLRRTPLRALLRRPHGRHRGPAVDRIVCRHGLTRCDHCRPLYQAGVATRTALMTPTRLVPTLERAR